MRSQKKPDKPEIEIGKPGGSKPRQHMWPQPGATVLLYLAFIIISMYWWQGSQRAKQAEIPYSEFLQRMDKGEVSEAIVTDKVITGTLTERDPNTNEPRQFITVPLWNNDLAKELEQKGVKYTVRESSNWLSDFFFSWVMPFGLLFLFWGWMGRRMAGVSKGFLNIGNRIHIHPEGDIKIGFKDVAGADDAKQELGESIAFLRDPSAIQRLGGRAPKGVLLVGAPGTGKTLLARAVAGEAQVPFFNISGSEFIEMFVGMGAARVRELFEQARQKAPCIIFIDELDAIGGARGLAPIMSGGHDEREQTLNQLLTEMDGFDPSVGVVVMAATNRPEILDKALLRAGRFDRHVVVEKPDLEARVAILRLHTRRMTLAPMSTCALLPSARRALSAPIWPILPTRRPLLQYVLAATPLPWPTLRRLLTVLSPGPRKSGTCSMLTRNVAWPITNRGMPWLQRVCPPASQCTRYPLFRVAWARWDTLCNCLWRTNFCPQKLN